MGQFKNHLQTILLAYYSQHKDKKPIEKLKDLILSKNISLQPDNVRSILVDELRYLKINPATADGEPLLMTPKGVEFLESGGFVKEEKLEELSERKLKAETVNAEWYKKTRWVPLAISIISLILSMFALFK